MPRKWQIHKLLNKTTSLVWNFLFMKHRTEALFISLKFGVQPLASLFGEGRNMASSSELVMIHFPSLVQATILRQGLLQWSALHGLSGAVSFRNLTVETGKYSFSFIPPVVAYAVGRTWAVINYYGRNMATSRKFIVTRILGNYVA